MIEQLVKFFVVFFVVVDPISLIPLFAGLTQGASARYKKKMAGKATVIALGICVLFALVGAKFLGLMGISLSSFRIAGGTLLFLIALDMVFARPSGTRSTTSEQEEAKKREDISVFPLAFPFIAGPGALATILLTAGEVGAKPLLFGGFLGVVALVLIVCWVLDARHAAPDEGARRYRRQCREPAIRRDSRGPRRAVHRRRYSRQLSLTAPLRSRRRALAIFA